MGSLEQIKLKKLVEESQPNEEAKDQNFSFKYDQEGSSSNPSDKFSYLGHVNPMTSDPSSF